MTVRLRANVAYAVGEDFVLLIASAIDRESGGSADIEGTQISPPAGLNYSWRSPSDLKRVAALRRKIRDELVRNNLTAAGRLSFERVHVALTLTLSVSEPISSWMSRARGRASVARCSAVGIA